MTIISQLQAWANLGWITDGMESQCHSHECTECREVISCRCGDREALWTTCVGCLIGDRGRGRDRDFDEEQAAA